MTHDLAKQLRSLGVTATSGISEHALAEIEDRYAIVFPDDLRDLLREMLPEGDGWPDWRRGIMIRRDFEGKEIDFPLDQVLGWPLDGILFDVEHISFWLEAWGERPLDIDEAKRIAASHVTMAPRLVPVYSHRYMSCEPRDPGNPVFSVHQTDIIVYGRDLASYFEAEFGDGWRQELTGPARPIRFWSEIAG